MKSNITRLFNAISNKVEFSEAPFLISTSLKAKLYKDVITSYNLGYNQGHQQAIDNNNKNSTNKINGIDKINENIKSYNAIKNDQEDKIETKQMNMYEAINSALRQVLSTDESAIVFGEDVAFGGVFRCTMGLQSEFGSARVFNTPLCEQGLVGFGVGYSSMGCTAIAEIQFADYVFPAFDQIVNEAAKYRYRSAGEWAVNHSDENISNKSISNENINKNNNANANANSTRGGSLTIRMPGMCVGHGALYHSQSPEGYFGHTPGLTVVVPRSPFVAKGLLLSSIRSPDPVIFVEPKILYRAVREYVPLHDYEIPIGKAEILNISKQNNIMHPKITIVSYGVMVYICAAAAKIAKERLGIECELIDLRTISPWDTETVCNSVNKTGRCIIVHEDNRASGIGAEISAVVSKECFLRLESPVQRVTGWDTHIPLALEKFYIPDVVRVYDSIKKSLEY